MKAAERGFTLLEILVALTVTAIVLGAIYGIAANISAAKEQLEKEGEGFHQARMLFSRLSREIHSAYCPAGVPGTSFRGGEDDRGRFFLELTTSAVSPLLPQSSGLARVRYELRDEPEDGSDLPVLVRMEQALLPGAEAGGMEHRLSGGIDAFRLRFFDGSGWQEEWDAASRGSLPQSVELYLEIEAGGKVLPFLTAIEIPRFGGI